MNKINDGGPAFPMTDPFVASPKTTDEAKRMAEGMSLRDYFAAKAMQVFLANPNGMYSTDASGAYAMADAMLAERAKSGAA